MTYVDSLVSIIMPAYNARSTIDASIQSVLMQTYTNWELIITDDGSNDGTRSYLETVNDSRIKVFFNKQNIGVAQTRNCCLNHASGRYIAFLDSDDLWTPKKLEIQLSQMVDKKAYFSASSYAIIDQNGTSMHRYLFVTKDITLDEMLRGSRIGCLTVMIDRNVTGDFAMPNVRHEDYVTWINLMLKHGSILGIKEVLAEYRTFGESVSSNKIQTAGWQYDIYRKYYNYSHLKSIYYFIHYGINGMIKYKSI